MFKVSINSTSRVAIKDSRHQNPQTVERCRASAANSAAQHADSGDVQSQCCQLRGRVSHAFWNMTLCHEVTGSRRFGVPSPSRAKSLLGPPDRKERTPQLHLCENPRTCTCSPLQREGQGYNSCHKQEMTCSVDTVASLARAGRRYIYFGLHQ